MVNSNTLLEARQHAVPGVVAIIHDGIVKIIASNNLAFSLIKDNFFKCNSSVVTWGHATTVFGRNVDKRRAWEHYNSMGYTILGNEPTRYIYHLCSIAYKNRARCALVIRPSTSNNKSSWKVLGLWDSYNEALAYRSGLTKPAELLVVSNALTDDYYQYYKV